MVCQALSPLSLHNLLHLHSLISLSTGNPTEPKLQAVEELFEAPEKLLENSRTACTPFLSRMGSSGERRGVQLAPSPSTVP